MTAIRRALAASRAALRQFGVTLRTLLIIAARPDKSGLRLWATVVFLMIPPLAFATALTAFMVVIYFGLSLFEKTSSGKPPGEQPGS